MNTVRDKLSESDFISMYSDYLSDRGILATTISRQSYKTPDMNILNGSDYFLNEIKIPELIFNEEQQLFVFKTTHSKLLEFIGRAHKQLSEYDSSHDVPWIITFASNHFQLNWKNFQDSIRGGVEFDGALRPDFTNTEMFTRTVSKINEIDLYIWFQVTEANDELYQVSFFVNPNSRYLSEVNNIVDCLHGYPLTSMDNIKELVT